MVRTVTCRTLLCRVHRYLLDAFIVCLMGHTAVQTSVAAGFSGSGGHTFPRADADRDLAKRQLVQRLSDEILHVRSRHDDLQTRTDQNGRVTFLPKLFGTDAVQSPRVRVLWIRDVGKACVFAFRGSGATHISRAGNPKRQRPNCHSVTPRSRGVGTLVCAGPQSTSLRGLWVSGFLPPGNGGLC